MVWLRSPQEPGPPREPENLRTARGFSPLVAQSKHRGRVEGMPSLIFSVTFDVMTHAPPGARAVTLAHSRLASAWTGGADDSVHRSRFACPHPNRLLGGYRRWGAARDHAGSSAERRACVLCSVRSSRSSRRGSFRLLAVVPSVARRARSSLVGR